jgi:Predicted AAA-ATPase
VDEYDAPTNTCLTNALNMGDHSSDGRREIQWVENILKPQFFGVIKRRCGDSVAKYWVTGVLPAFRDGISPLTATRVISFDEKYQSLCGFTQKDVDAIVS